MDNMLLEMRGADCAGHKFRATPEGPASPLKRGNCTVLQVIKNADRETIVRFSAPNNHARRLSAPG